MASFKFLAVAILGLVSFASAQEFGECNVNVGPPCPNGMRCFAPDFSKDGDGLCMAN